MFIKSIWVGIFPRAMPYAECFRRAKNAGFDAVELTMASEISLASSTDELKRIDDEARKTGVSIASLWVSPLGSSPLNSPDPNTRNRGVEAIRKAIEFAIHLHCGALLLVPGRVGAGAKLEVGYETTWECFSTELRKVIPDAEQAKVILTIENISASPYQGPKGIVPSRTSPSLGIAGRRCRLERSDGGVPESWLSRLPHTRSLA